MGRLRNDCENFYDEDAVGTLPSRIRKLYSRASCRTSFRLSNVAVMPVGLHPYYINHTHEKQYRLSPHTLRLTGTVYKHFGFAFPTGQLSRIDRSDREDIPLASVSTSV